MNKQLIASICILGLVGMVVGVAVQGVEDSVTAYVTPGVVSVTVTPETFDYGYMTLNTSKTSHEAGETSGITAAVGSVNTDLDIKGAAATDGGSGSWALGGSAGSDIYVHGFGLNANPGSYTPLTTDVQDLASVSTNGNQVFGLEITTPSSSAVLGTQYSVPVTVVATWGG